MRNDPALSLILWHHDHDLDRHRALVKLLAGILFNRLNAPDPSWSSQGEAPAGGPALQSNVVPSTPTKRGADHGQR